MSISKKLLGYLDKNKTKYSVIPHRTVYTAYDAAQTLRKKLDDIAKNLLIKADRKFFLAIVPASKNLDFKKLKVTVEKAWKGKITKFEFPKENVMKKVFKVKPGALHAFGSLNKLPIFMDKSLKKAKKAIFSSGSFEHSLEMAVKDFEKLEKPIIGMFSVAKKIAKGEIKKLKRK